MSEYNLVQLISIWVVPVLLAITVHETAHGWVASRLGDKTALMLGRLTLNPFKHIDLFGTILLPAMMIMLVGIALGYAKPVPVDWRNLNNPKRDMAVVAAAGPFVNLLMAAAWALLIRVGLGLGDSGLALVFMGVAGIFINVVLMVINMLPLPPLDGGRVVTGLLPGPYAYQFARIEPYGFFILVGLLVTGILGIVMWPVVKLVLQLMASVAGMKPGYLETILFALMRS